MGIQDVDFRMTPEDLRDFVKHLLNDLRALEMMIAEGMIESRIRRIGAEQELFLVNPALRPVACAQEILDELADPHYTNEIALFNLEINLDPITYGGGCLSAMELRLDEMIGKVRTAAANWDANIVLAGILPTIRKSDIGLNNMTPKPRYVALNNALARERQGAYEFKVQGADELIIKHDSWMLEACCTSFQVHLQVAADEFASLYNAAQAATAPVLAAAANSPLLFGRRLWRETRIPLFEQSIDTRTVSSHLRERSPRVSFGQQWVKRSPLELFEEDIARFRVLVGADEFEDPFSMLRQGLTPELSALRVFNSTVWRWNRACYGITQGKPHLRIEARAFPAGPTVIDQVANAAFFFGLMSGLSADGQDIGKEMDFEAAKANFYAAAYLGLEAQLTWTDRRVMPARELICQHLLPLARAGLFRSKVVRADIDRYLGVIEERVNSGRTGSQWILDSFSALKTSQTREEAMTSLTAALVDQQNKDGPVHQWPPAQAAPPSAPGYLRVEEFMTTDLFTVHEDEPLDLVASLMNWKHVRHIPVEDAEGKLVGMLSCFDVLYQFERSLSEGKARAIVVSSIMNRDPVTIAPEAPTLEAIALMRREKVDCLPVVKDGRLLGIVTERDFITVAARLLGERREALQQVTR